MDFLNSLGLNVAAFIFVLGVLIFIHELGHYLVAKRLGIRVEVFSLGFGRRLLGFKRGATDYRISLIPLGGYVKMAGENPEEELTGSAEEFLSRPKLHRFAVAIAGPLMNIGLAILLLTITFMVGIDVRSHLAESPIIGSVRFDSQAEKAGLLIGDRILSINGTETPTWKDAEFVIGTSPNLTLTIELSRQEEPIQREVFSESTQPGGPGAIGVGPFVPYHIEMVEPDSAAADAGLRRGDEIAGVLHRTQLLTGFYMVAEVVRNSQGEPLRFQIRRDGQLLDQDITPRLIDGRPRLGAFVEFPVETQQLGLIGALGRSLRENYRVSRLVFVIVGRLITGQASIAQMSGPIEIARFSGMAASLGWLALLGFMGLVSLQLGILNLMPIPILDGGVILLLIVEGLIGRDLSLRAKERIFRVGLIFLVLLMGVVIVNDISKNLPSVF